MRQTRPDQTRPEPFFRVTQSCCLHQSFIDLSLLNARGNEKRMCAWDAGATRTAQTARNHAKAAELRQQLRQETSA